MGFVNRVVEGLFFSTDRRQYWDYRQFRLSGEEFTVPGPGESKLCGLVLHAARGGGLPPRGTVLFFHNCTQNMGNHLAQVAWLTEAGYQVVMFDPQGCGDSTGTLSLNGYVDDSEAVYRHTLSLPGVTAGTLILFGQGPGADAALRLLRRHPDGAAAIVVVSPCATYRGWILRRYGPGLGHMIAAFLPPGLDENPIDALREVKIPLALMIPGKDDTVPKGESGDVMVACPKHRELWLARNERMLTAFGKETEWRGHFLEFAKQALKGKARAAQ